MTGRRADARHGPDPGGLVVGAVFIVIGGAFLAAELDWWTLRVRYLLPLLLMAVGAALVASRARR